MSQVVFGTLAKCHSNDPLVYIYSQRCMWSGLDSPSAKAGAIVCMGLWDGMGHDLKTHNFRAL